MSTDTATQSRRRRLFQRLRNSISHRTQVILSESSISTPSTEPPRLTGSEQESSVLSSTQSASGPASVPTAQPSPEAPTGTTTSPAQGPAATSTLCRGVLEKALERLTAPDRVIIQEYVSSNDIASALGHAFEAAEAKRKVCESKRWTFTVGSHTLNLQDEADKVILWLDRFKQVGDVAANADPVQAGLPWAGVRLLLEAAVSEAHQMKALLTGLKTALYTMNRLKAYLEYLSILPASQSRSNFESALVEFHAHILQFLAGAIRIYQKGSLSRAFDVFWKSDEIGNFEMECDRIAARAEIEASNCDCTVSAQERKEANGRKKHLQRALEELEEIRGIERTINTLADTLTGKIDLARLPSVDGAAFDSYQDELDARCHPDTRIDLLRQINDWAEDQHGRCIFWLNGMAGTGKSTISRTVAQTFADAGRLGASFFFKRGEGERGNASRFFTTIATQMVYTVPAIVPYLNAAINADPGISGKMMKEQFNSLIFRPLSEVGEHSATMIERVIVIDALDECEREGDIRNILHLLSQTHRLDSINLRIFLTSRPELPIRLGFKTISAGVHQDVILQEIAKDTIKHDITSFLKAEFQKIRQDHNNSRLEELFLPEDWPGEWNIQILSRMAVPLFISAATVSRFVGDLRWNPKKRLEIVLRYQLNSQASKLEKTYLPVLDNLMADLSDSEKDVLAQEFRAVVGSIIILAEPLGTSPLARLLNVDKRTIDCRLDSLHSVLSVPSSPDIPMNRGTHLSVFLSDARRFIAQNRSIIHNAPLQLYYSAIIFTPTESVIRRTFEKPIPWISGLPKVPHAWNLELQKLEGHSARANDVAFSPDGQLLASASEEKTIRLWSPSTGEQLQQLEGHSASVKAVAFSIDGQLLASASDDKTVRLWSLATGEQIQQLEGHEFWVSAIAFSANGELLASASLDRTVRLWNPTTGEQLLQLEGHHDSVSAVAFSTDGQLLASASWDNTVKFWNPVTGEQLQQLIGHNNSIHGVVFSADGQLLASASVDMTVRLWNPVTGEQMQQLQGHSGSVLSVAFSTDAQLLASASTDKTVMLWNSVTGNRIQQLEGHSGHVTAVAFSADGQLLASASDDRTIRLWNPVTGEQSHQPEGHSEEVSAVAFSDGQLFASVSTDYTVKLWNPSTAEQLKQLKGHSSFINGVVFSADSHLLASTSNDKTVRLWNTASGELVHKLEGHTDGVDFPVFSADGQLLASSSFDGTVRLWDPATGVQLHQLGGHINLADGTVNILTGVAFSADGQLLASVWRCKIIKIWDPVIGEQLHQLEGHSQRVNAVTFSTDSHLLASASNDHAVRLWKPTTGEQVQLLEGHTGSVNTLAFSADGQLLASASNDGTVRLWNPAMGEQLSQVAQINVRVDQLRFLDDDRCLETDRGTLQLHFDQSARQAVKSQDLSNIFLNGDWITRDKNNLLWLPADYRGNQLYGCFAFRGNILAIGQKSGQVHFFDFNT